MKEVSVIWQVPVARLVSLCASMPNTIWGVRVTRTMVRRRVEQGLLEATPYSEMSWPTHPSGYQEYHARRIAYLVVNGWEDPIELDFGVPVIGYFNKVPLVDGNHRFCASIARGDELIKADVYGQLSYAAHLLGISEGRVIDGPARRSQVISEVGSEPKEVGADDTPAFLKQFGGGGSYLHY